MKCTPIRILPTNGGILFKNKKVISNTQVGSIKNINKLPEDNKYEEIWYYPYYL